MSWLDLIADTPELDDLAARLDGGGGHEATGVTGSSISLTIAALARKLRRPLLLVVAHLDEADEAQDELEALSIEAAKLPAMEIVPGETSVNLELLGERLGLLRRLAAGDVPPVVVAPIQALMQTVPRAEGLGEMLRVLRAGETLDAGELVRWLDHAGYRRVETIESPGEFAPRGGIVDLFPVGGEPCRLDLFGDEIEGLFAVDLDTMGSDRRLDRIELVGASVEQLQRDEGTVPFATCLPRETAAVFAEVLELTEQGRGYHDALADARGILPPASVFKSIRAHCHATVELGQMAPGTAAPGQRVDLPVAPLPTFHETAAEGVKELAELSREARTFVLCRTAGEHERLEELLAETAAEAQVTVETHYLHRGLIWSTPPRRSRSPWCRTTSCSTGTRCAAACAAPTGEKVLDAFVELEVGDYVVHRDHGIGSFLGLRMLPAAGRKENEPEEFLAIEFSRGAKINVPAAKIDLVQKYIGAFGGKPELSTVGGKRWSNQKEKVADAVRDLAAEMLRLQAARSSLPGIRYPADTTWQHEFEAGFPYEETEDQVSAIRAVKRDMTGEQPMDRLVCGDVGFGKTEVAIRAAFKAVEYGKQVAVLVPTTVLADQHERTFRQRFADYPFRVETVSRFKTKKEQTQIINELKRGRVDIIIGTHRLLSEDVHFADLGLVVIDEEQRFGVEHKHKLLGFRATADVMTLSATPIPRTLHMAMLGLRDISSLTTPPLDRRAIVTEVLPHDQRRIRQALVRELAREGQVFYVHNRVHNIESVADDVRRLVPEARIIIGHGQMPSRQLESVMRKFIRGEADILVCTTIIESGIDIPTANTMIVNDANIFGLSELHQLRGRVGRYKHRAYCYLLLPRDRTITTTAMKRLRALESFTMLGAGFKIALRDLEIRGAGNLLGAEQSGHIAAVGYEMYCQLLEHAVADLKNERKPSVVDCVVDLGIAGTLPKGYIPSDTRHMDAYRRVCRADSVVALEKIRTDLASAYSALPARAEVLFELAEIRVAAAHLGIRSITRHEGDVIFKTAIPRDLESRLRGAKGSVRLVGDVDPAGLTTVYFRPPANYLETATILAVLRRRLGGGAAEVEEPVVSAAR